MDDDWDLHAVVRGCAAATTTTTDTTTTTTTNNPFPSFTPNFHEDHQDSFDFPGLIDDRNDPFQGLQEIYQEFCLDAPPPATTSSAGVDTATVPVLAAQVFQPHREIVQIQPPLLQMNMQSQESIQFKNPTLASPSHHSFPAANPQPIRQRRRKNQQMKMVRQMTQEELSADSWAWRKYGQKPIKGSPYPRNYYRCSTSKGCAARKQVERSPNDEGIFVVSYTGEHTHPRPAHRSSLAGSTRSKFAAASKSNNIENNAHLFQKGSVSSSSTASGSSFSPCSPLMEGEAAAQNDDVEMAEEEDGGGDEDDENVIVIPNDLMNDDEDMFKGFQDSDHSSGGGTCFQVACYHHRRGRPPAQPLTLPTSTAEEEADQSPEKMGYKPFLSMQEMEQSIKEYLPSPPTFLIFFF